MRQRKAKDLEKRLENCIEYMTEPGGMDGFGKYFRDEGDMYAEIGCGKGNFIIKKALDEPSKNFLAVEGQETVMLRAVEKVKKLEENGDKLSNLKFMMAFVDRMGDFFKENQLAGIYLNFSDPWPKARHAKRRLTYRKRLKDYGWAVRAGGFIEIKTDNDPLYEFTLEEIEAVGYEIAEQTRDLHGSGYKAKYTMTEYEEKFKDKGKNINYVKVLIK